MDVPSGSSAIVLLKARTSATLVRRPNPNGVEIDGDRYAFFRARRCARSNLWLLAYVTDATPRTSARSACGVRTQTPRHLASCATVNLSPMCGKYTQDLLRRQANESAGWARTADCNVTAWNHARYRYLGAWQPELSLFGDLVGSVEFSRTRRCRSGEWRREHVAHDAHAEVGLWELRTWDRDRPEVAGLRPSSEHERLDRRTSQSTHPRHSGLLTAAVRNHES